MEPQKSFNGWSNFQTWKIHLEIFNGRQLTPDQIEGGVYKLSESLREHVEKLLHHQADGLALDLAIRYIKDVDFDEIAAALIRDNIAENV
jgi:hypothetical protein